ncbi:hypothetical protein NC651_013288 [Populus alba x Populus x berolinensis]|nr:hypothetical protein NC651_013288 [Populus alba x Populus x berolinensis]
MEFRLEPSEYRKGRDDEYDFMTVLYRKNSPHHALTIKLLLGIFKFFILYGPYLLGFAPRASAACNATGDFEKKATRTVAAVNCASHCWTRKLHEKEKSPYSTKPNQDEDLVTTYHGRLNLMLPGLVVLSSKASPPPPSCASDFQAMYPC